MWGDAGLDVGWFRKDGLHELMPFIILHARSGERSWLPLRGWFLSRHWFTLCITMELQNCTNATTAAFAKITGERWWRMEMSVFASFFLADQKIAVCGEKKNWHPVEWATSHYLCQTHYDYGPSKMPLKFTNWMTPPSTLKKACTRSRSAKRLYQCWVKVKGVHNPVWTAQYLCCTYGDLLP